MHLANCMALAAVYFTTLIENLRLCSCHEAGIVLNLLLDLKKNEHRVLIKLFLHIQLQ